MELERIQGRAELFGPARANHDRGHVRVGEQPGEGERAGSRPALGCLRLERLECVEDPVVLELEVRLGPERHA